MFFKNSIISHSTSKIYTHKKFRESPKNCYLCVINLIINESILYIII